MCRKRKMILHFLIQCSVCHLKGGPFIKIFLWFYFLTHDINFPHLKGNYSVYRNSAQYLKHLCSALPWSSEDFKTKMFNSKGLPTFSKISLVISYYAASCAVSYSDTNVSCYGVLTSKRVHVNWDMGHQSAALKSGVCHHFFQFGARVSRNFCKRCCEQCVLKKLDNWRAEDKVSLLTNYLQQIKSISKLCP